MKKRLLCLMASLLLCGAVSAQHFTAPNAHAKSGNTPIVAAVTVDNVAPTTGAELAVYVGDELRGLATTTLEGKYWVQVFYNSGSTEDLTFKLWDPTDEGAELDTYTLTYGDLTALTTCEEGYGTPGNPVELNFQTTQTMTQTTQFAQEWTWWSTPIELNGINGLEMLENSLGSDGLYIKAQNAYVQNYYPSLGYDYWFGGLTSIGLSNEAGYQISVSGNCSATMVGTYANPADHPITLAPGWTWIGYPCSNQQTPSAAYSSFSPSANDVVKGQNGFATYYENYGWFPTSFVLTPGYGYMYNSYASVYRSLTITNSRSESIVAIEEPLLWRANYHSFANNLCITAVVSIDGLEQDRDKLELDAFVNGECRGSAHLVYFEPTNRWYAMMTISGDEGDIIEFGLVDETTDNANMKSGDRIAFTRDVIIGSLDDPYTVHFGSKGSLNNEILLYPNPVDRNDTYTIDIPANESAVEVLIFNSFGQPIVHDNGAINLSRMKAISTSGIYTIKVTCKSGNTYIGKIIVK